MRKIFLFAFLLAQIQAFAQNYEAEVSKDTSTTTLTKNNFNVFLTVGSFVKNGDEHIKETQPISVNVGLQYLYKANKNIGIYSNFSFTSNRFSVIQDPGISFPTANLHDQNNYSFIGLQLAGGFSFIIPKKSCIDEEKTSFTLYGFGEFYYYKELEVTGKLNSSNSPFASSYTTTYKKLSYIAPINYGIGGEVKIYFIYLGTRYFLSDFIEKSFKNDHNWPTLPKLKIYLKYKF
jgi:hypothetical protein